jgi:hypothetical protein
MNGTEVTELEWYLRDHLFRQYNQGKRQFKKETLPEEMIKLYLRYRNSDVQKMSVMIDCVLERLISQLVITQSQSGIIELTSAFSRLQCYKCFYICYLSNNEPKKCTRCSAVDLHGFPKKK